LSSIPNVNLASPSVGTPDSLIQPLRLHLARVQAQELAKLIGQDNLDQIAQVWREKFFSA